MSATTCPWEQRAELANRYAPHLVLFPEKENLARPGQPGEIGDFYPRGVELVIDHSQFTMGAFQPRGPATIPVLGECNDRSGQLLVLNRSLPDPDLAWKSYFEILNRPGQDRLTGRERYPITVYARALTRAEANAESQDVRQLGESSLPDLAHEVGGPFFKPTNAREDDLAIQYWFCYYYDDWANQHEGDWEGICLFFRFNGDDYLPLGASYYAHETGLRRRWQDVERSSSDGDTHPIVYVAAGSHASYFQYVDMGYVTTVKNYILPFINLKLKVGLASTRFDIVPNPQVCAPVKPERLQVLPAPIGPPDPNAPEWKAKEWLAYPGHWGVNVLGGLGFGGPTGPQQKGLKWHNPFVWMERNCGPDYLVY